MKIPVISKYLNWLQLGTPFGEVEKLPELTDQNETSVPGVYCIGDLTGIPLIKTALNSGPELIEILNNDTKFQDEIKSDGDDIFDIIIAGAGPAGASAAIKARELGFKIKVLESSKVFNTLHDYPAGKPIHVNPKNSEFKSVLKFSDGNKESLLKELEDDFVKNDPEVSVGESVQEITGEKGSFKVKTSEGEYRARRVIIAIGKSGNSRKLKIPGEDFDKVYSKLVDPAEFNNKNILVVGGGDSAIETAVALAKEGNTVTLSYRKAQFSRPKEENVKAFNDHIIQGNIKAEFETNVKEIFKDSVTLLAKEGEKKISNDLVFVLVGREVPVKFFERSKIKMQGAKSISANIELIALLSFFIMLYFGKVGVAVSAINFEGSFFQNIISYLSIPFKSELAWGVSKAQWYSSFNFIVGWIGSMVFLFTGLFSFGKLVVERKARLSSPWGIIKNSYFIFVAVFYTIIHFSSLYTKNAGWVEEPTYWYSLLYCTTMLIFGIRRMVVKPTGYIIRQTSLLIFIQIFFLFLLPFYLYDLLLIKILAADGYVLSEIFPKGKWSSFGLILFWPLNIGNFGNSSFWIWFPIVQTFILLPALIYFFGKGVYCGWICSCGGMAETLGDEYRTKAPHSEKAKRWENFGQFALLFAFIVTTMNFIAPKADSTISANWWAIYKILIDVIFAGALGLGLYFFYSGRIWCRYGCPLAALMHIYTRFSKYRILSRKEDCISCGICTKYCHMGIDVMNYASKGIPMNDVECVACSTCIVRCPMDVLEFGQTKNSDSENLSYKSTKLVSFKKWLKGL